jgi:hypothetical protein
MKTIASLPVSQTNELIERLKELAIPNEKRTVPDPSGVDLNEIMVEDSYYDRGCEVAEAWNAEQLSKLTAMERAASISTATTKSKWPLLWAFCSGSFLVFALRDLSDHNIFSAVIQLLLSVSTMMKAVYELNDA